MRKVMKRFRRLSWALLLTGVCALQPQTLAYPTLEFATFSTSVRAIIFKEILTEAYQRIGIKILVAPYPARRGIELADIGILDGEAGRLAHIQDLYQNLIMVPVPIFTNSTVAFTKNKQIKISSWDDLSHYSVTSMLGLKYTESKLKGHPQAHFVNSIQKAFSLMDKQRYDITIFSLHDGLNVINQLPLNGVQTIPFETIPSYHFIHKKHVKLLPEITRALQEIKTEGLIDKISSEFLANLEAGNFYDVTPDLENIPRLPNNNHSQAQSAP